MKYLIIFFYVLGVLRMHAEGEDFLDALGAYKSAVKTGSGQEVIQASDDLIQQLDKLGAENKKRWQANVALVHFHKSRAYAEAGDFDAAARELREELGMLALSGGQLDQATKLPDQFFSDVVELQALIADEIGSDPLLGKVSYMFERKGQGFVAARLDSSGEISGIDTPEMSDGELLAQVHQISRNGRTFKAFPARWFIVRKGVLAEVLEDAAREIVFDPGGKLQIKKFDVGDAPLRDSGTKVPADGAGDSELGQGTTREGNNTRTDSNVERQPSN